MIDNNAVRRLLARVIENETSREAHVHVLIPEASTDRYKWSCTKCFRMFKNKNGISLADLKELKYTGLSEEEIRTADAEGGK